MDLAAQVLDFVATSESAATVVFRMLRLADHGESAAASGGTAYPICVADKLTLTTLAPRVLLMAQRLLLLSDRNSTSESSQLPSSPLRSMTQPERDDLQLMASIAQEVMLQSQGNASAFNVRDAVQQRYPGVNSTVWLNLAGDTARSLTAAAVRLVEALHGQATTAQAEARQELLFAALYGVALVGQVVAVAAVLQGELRRRRIVKQEDELTARSSFIRYVSHETRK